MKRLYYAFRWRRAGVSWCKACEIAGMGRKASYRNEVIVLCGLFVAYAFVAWNDAEAALERLGHEYASSMMQKNKAEVALIHMLNGKAMLIDEKSWTQCYSSTTL